MNRKEVYSVESLMTNLKSSDKIVLISGIPNSLGKPVNFLYYRGAFCENKVFNLSANFTNYKTGEATVKSFIKKCGCLCLTEMLFDDERVRKAYCYDNFIKSFKK